MEPKLCPRCDTLLDPDARFCSGCGNSLAMAAQMPLADTQPATMAAYQQVAPPAPAPAPPVIAPPAYQQPVYQQPVYQQVPQPLAQPMAYSQPYQQAPQYLYQQAPVQQVNVVMSNANPTPAVVMVKQKSVAVALLLTLFFGPLGMFYSTVSGAVIMLIVSVVLALLTAGASIIVTELICMIWGAMAANSHNKTIVARL